MARHLELSTRNMPGEQPGAPHHCEQIRARKKVWQNKNLSHYDTLQTTVNEDAIFYRSLSSHPTSRKAIPPLSLFFSLPLSLVSFTLSETILCIVHFSLSFYIEYSFTGISWMEMKLQYDFRNEILSSARPCPNSHLYQIALTCFQSEWCVGYWYDYHSFFYNFFFYFFGLFSVF